MFYKKAVLLKTLQYFKTSQDEQETPVMRSIFNSEYCKIFKSTYFEEHLQTAASENVFMKLRKIKNYSKGVLILHYKNRFFQHQYQTKVKISVFIL